MPELGSLDFKITVDGEEQLSRRFNRMAARARDLTPFFSDDVPPILGRAIKHQFDVSGEPMWPPLSAAYARLKARKFGRHPILVRTGALRMSLVAAGAPGNIKLATATSLTWGTSLRVGKGGKYNLGLIHQRGAPKAKIPARPLLRLLRDFKSKLIHALRGRLLQET